MSFTALANASSCTNTSIPPTYLFFTYPLGLMPYLTAYAVWVGLTFVVYAAAIYAVVPRSATLIAALASAAVLKNIELGHNGFLFAGLIGLSLFCLQRRPWSSGILLGFLTCKPQLGVLFPPVLLVSHNWRARPRRLGGGNLTVA